MILEARDRSGPSLELLVMSALSAGQASMLLTTIWGGGNEEK